MSALIMPEGVARTTGEPDATYYVWRVGGGPPRKPYHSRFVAEIDASRLAGKNPGAEFLVLKVKSGFRKPADEPVGK